MNVLTNLDLIEPQVSQRFDDHLVVSLDFQQIELVLIGEFSGDPEFARVYGKTPYDDLHIIAAADCLGMTEAEFLGLKKGIDPGVRPLTDKVGNVMEPAKAYKYFRTEVGKGANFNIFFSGNLSTVGERLGWTQDEMWEATERYWNRFHVANQWRLETIGHGQQHGWVPLPDGHRRVRFEATSMWADGFRAKFGPYAQHEGVQRFRDLIIRRIQSRANNQIINAVIQGSCATLTKRSILGIRERLRSMGWGPREVRFMFPVHDEVVYSVHRALVRPFIEMATAVMTSGSDIIKNLPVACSPSVGATFQPWDAKNARIGQIELFEAPEIDVVPKEKVGGRLDPHEWDAVVDWLFAERDRLRRA